MRQPGDRLALLVQAGRELTATVELAGVLRRALALSVQAVDASLGSLFLLDEAGNLSTAVLLEEGRFQRSDLDLARRMLRAGLAAHVSQTRQATLIRDTRLDPRWVEVDANHPGGRAGSVIAVPLLAQSQRLIGVLTCTHPQPAHLDEQDLETLELLANHIAVAVESARLFAAEEQRRLLADTLSEIARILTATLDLDEVLRLILEQLERVIPFHSASIFLLEQQRLVIHAWRGLDENLVRHLSFSIDSSQIMSRVITRREPLLCADVQQEAGWNNLAGAESIRGWIGAPLVARGEVVGAITVDSHDPDTYDEHDTRIVAAFADHAAIAVANARLWQQTQKQLDEVAFLHETGQTLTASLELPHILQALVQQIRLHLDVKAASVALVEPDTGALVFQAASGAAANQIVGLRLQRGQGVAGWVAQSGKPVVVPLAHRDRHWYNGIDQATGFQTQTMVAVPITWGGQAIGVIEAVNPHQGHLEEDDLRLLTSVAILAASAIENARHFSRARDAEQRYASLFENSADPIVITDDSGAIIDANRLLCQMLGRPRSELLGCPLAALLTSATNDLNRVLHGESGTLRSSVLNGDGGTTPCEIHAARVYLGGRPCVQWILYDLSEQLALEQARQELTHMIIHDLRNPLAAIVNSLEMLRLTTEGNTSPPIDQLFEIAQRNSSQMRQLIDSILDIARLEAGQQQLADKEIDVAELVGQSIEQLRPIAAARSQTLESNLPPLPPARGDRSMLRRVVRNLLDNAVKFTPLGGAVRVASSQIDETTLRVSVADTGPGIPEEYREHIFDRFFRLPNSRASGSGLGLAFCKLAVEAHGGRIWVESVVDQGSTFHFTLPLDQPARGLGGSR